METESFDQYLIEMGIGSKERELIISKIEQAQFKKEREYILCAANHYDDGIEHTFNPRNIKTGFVICGHRHHNCISTFAQMVGFPYSKKSQELQNTEIQGFLTNKNKFVDRKEACRIAMLAEQIEVDPEKFTLYSEDLY